MTDDFDRPVLEADPAPTWKGGLLGTDRPENRAPGWREVPETITTTNYPPNATDDTIHVNSPTPDTEERPPIYCTGGCDVCRDYARELGVPLIVPPPPLAVTPPQADRGLREAIKALPEMVGEPNVGWSLVRRTDVLALLRDTPPAGLDAAWAEAEAALPEGCVMDGVRRLYDNGVPEEQWIARAVWPDVHSAVGAAALEFTYGDTPAAALLVLAARLRDEEPGS